MHMAWMRTVCGRLKSDYQYSAGVVYNNFIWPKDTGDDAIANAATGILNARKLYDSETLATLYDPLLMPAELIKAHEANNKAVDKAYGYTGADDDASRAAFLFKKFEEITSFLPAPPAKKKRVKKVDDTQTNLI